MVHLMLPLYFKSRLLQGFKVWVNSDLKYLETDFSPHGDHFKSLHFPGQKIVLQHIKIMTLDTGFVWHIFHILLISWHIPPVPMTWSEQAISFIVLSILHRVSWTSHLQEGKIAEIFLLIICHVQSSSIVKWVNPTWSLWWWCFIRITHRIKILPYYLSMMASRDMGSRRVTGYN